MKTWVCNDLQIVSQGYVQWLTGDCQEQNPLRGVIPLSVALEKLIQHDAVAKQVRANKNYRMRVTQYVVLDFVLLLSSSGMSLGYVSTGLNIFIVNSAQVDKIFEEYENV